ncbi:MAG: hypothetical protein ABI415_07030 [Flavitalea sp.]
MDVLDNGLLHFWKALNDNDVKYIMIGGFAIRFHGFSRNTDDIDLWLNDTPANRKALRKAFTDLKYGDFELLETMEFVPGWTNFFIGDGIELDIVTKMKGLEHLSFEECLEMSSIAELEGIKIPFLHINHLIANKKIINRPKDQIDVMELERIKELRDKL